MNNLNRPKPKKAQSDICVLAQMSVLFLKWTSRFKDQSQLKQALT